MGGVLNCALLLSDSLSLGPVVSFSFGSKVVTVIFSRFVLQSKPENPGGQSELTLGRFILIGSVSGTSGVRMEEPGLGDTEAWYPSL